MKLYKSWENLGELIVAQAEAFLHVAHEVGVHHPERLLAGRTARGRVLLGRSPSRGEHEPRQQPKGPPHDSPPCFCSRSVCGSTRDSSSVRFARYTPRPSVRSQSANSLLESARPSRTRRS